MSLPGDWPLGAQGPPDAQWPVGYLALVAKHPLRHREWLWRGSTLTLDESAECCAAVIGMPRSTPTAFDTLELDDRTVPFWTALPVTADERDFAREFGSLALQFKMRAAGFDEQFVPGRPAVVGPPSSWRHLPGDEPLMELLARPEDGFFCSECQRWHTELPRSFDAGPAPAHLEA